MASTPWEWLSTMTYWSRSPRSASTAFSNSAGAETTSATSPKTPLSLASVWPARVMRLRTPAAVALVVADDLEQALEAGALLGQLLT